MTSSLSKYASSLILLEWGAIMLYFNLSGRVSAFLHPNFRPLLWLVGVSLALTAVITAFAHKSECCGADEALLTHDHGRGAHHHEHSHHGDQAHKGLTAASVMSFLVLCVPIALAAVISPDRFGETFLRNRGTIESVQVLSGSDAKSAPQPSAEDNSPLSKFKLKRATEPDRQPGRRRVHRTSLCGTDAPRLRRRLRGIDRC
jgi:uncharacterized membrane protein YcgQ (UPF0703/DUF1980 family)